MPVRLSKSGLVQWDICPRGYKYRYVNRIPTPANFPMQRGTAFHNFADDLFQTLSFESLRGLKDRDDVAKVFISCADAIDVPKFLDKIVKNFVQYEIQRFLDMQGLDDPVKYYKPFLLEEKVVVENAIENITLSGIIDRVDLTSQGTLALIEYKTSPRLHDRIEKELLFYTLLLEASGRDYPPITHLVAYSPIINGARIWEINKRKKTNLRKKIVKVSKAIIAREFIPKESPLCATCSFLELCLNATLQREEVLTLLTDEAYSITELTIALDCSRGLIRGLLYDMRTDGIVDSGFDGNTEYWWVCR